MLPILLLLALTFSTFGAGLESVGFISSSTLDSFGETAGGYGSAAAYDAQVGILYLTSDRGPGDGTIDYAPRLFAVPIPSPNTQNPVGTQASASKPAPEPGAVQSPPTSKDSVNVIVNLNQPSSARLYKDPDGKPFTGLIPDSNDPEPRMQDGRRCLDPEGLALMKDGNLYVSEEYYPSVLQFKPDGTFLARFVPPENYLPRNAAGEVDFRAMEKRTEGREDNRGFEGVARSPDGKTIYTILQSALTQDGGREAGATRLLAFDSMTGSPKSEYAIRLTDPVSLEKKGNKLKSKNISLTELAFLPDGRLIAIERDNRGQDGSADSKPAVLKQVITLDLNGATDLLSLPDKPYSQRPFDPKFKKLDARQNIQYVKTNTLFDFASLDLPSKGLAWEKIPEKWEGLAFLPDDRLFVISDNDFLTPELTLGGKKIPFPKCQNPVDTWWFTVKLR